MSEESVLAPMAPQTANDAPSFPLLAVGTLAGTITLLHSATGQTLWQTRLNGLLGAAACDSDAVYAIAGDHLQPRLRHDPGSIHYRVEYPFTPTQLEARQARGGALLWRKNDWQLAGSGMLALDGATILATGRNQIGDQRLYALDARTGDVRWTYAGADHPASSEPAYERVAQILIGAWHGRAYLVWRQVRRDGPHSTVTQWLCAVDVATGAEVWRRPHRHAYPYIMQPSPQGTLLCLVESPLDQTQPDMVDKQAVFIALDAATTTAGEAERASLLLGSHERLCGLAEDGIAYLAIPSRQGLPHELLRAVRISSGEVQWEIPHKSSPIACAVTDERIFTARRFQRDTQNWYTGVAEVAAFDRRTGVQLWRWRSPHRPAGMLRLWGWRTLDVFVTAAAEATRQIASRLMRRDLLSLWYWLSSEVRVGQWRHPQEIDHTILLQADETQTTLYVGARIGVVALDMASGAVRWFALPTEAALMARPQV